jgi:hypothetical protein
MEDLRIFSALTTFSDLHVNLSHSQTRIFIQLSQIEENIYKIFCLEILELPDISLAVSSITGLDGWGISSFSRNLFLA